MCLRDSEVEIRRIIKVEFRVKLCFGSQMLQAMT